MLILMQILSLMSKEQAKFFESYFIEAEFEIKDKQTTAEEQADGVADFIFNHFGINIEMKQMHLDLLSDLIKRKTWKSAFKLKEIK